MSLYKRIFYFYLVGLVIFFLARVSLLIVYRTMFTDLSALRVGFAFIQGVRFDMSTLSAFFFLPLAAMAFPIKPFKSRLWLSPLSWITFVVLVTMTLGLIGDILYYEYVNRHTTHELLLLSYNDVKDVGGMAFGVYLPYLFLLVAAIFCVFLIWRKILRIPVTVGFRWFDPIIYILFLFSMIIVARGGFGYKPIAIIDAYASGNTKQADLILNGVFSATLSMLDKQNAKHVFFSEEEMKYTMGLDKEQPISGYPLERTAIGPNTGYNLVFVLVESLSFEYLDAYGGNGLGVTPNLDKLSSEGLKFMNIYAAGQRSVEGLQATLTGIPSVVGLPTISTGMVANYTKLGKMAEENGYATLFSQTSARGSMRVNSIAGASGFQSYFGMEDMPPLLDYPDPSAAKWGWDYENFMKMADQIESSPKPFLSYIITSTTHTPYPRLPERFEKYPHDENGENGFLNTLYYTDWCVGEFLERAKQNDWFDDTIFIFMADHVFQHSSRIRGVVPGYRIPLIIYSPNLFKSEIRTTVGSQVDILPTIIDLLGLKGNYSSFGDSLFSDVRKPYAIVRGGSIMGIITDKGYLRHSLKNRLETGSIEEKMPPKYFDQLEKWLLASVQMVQGLISSNHWFDQ